MGVTLMAHLFDVPETEIYSATGLGIALRLLQVTSDGQRFAIHRLVQEVRRQDFLLAEHQD